MGEPLPERDGVGDHRRSSAIIGDGGGGDGGGGGGGGSKAGLMLHGNEPVEAATLRHPQAEEISP